MTLDDAYRKLPEYLDGGLLPHERDEMEKLFSVNEQLKDALRTSMMLESALQQQTWIRPKPDFVRLVVKQAIRELPPQISAWDQNWDRIRTGLSILTLGLILVIARNPITDWSLALLGDAGIWLGSLTGITFFALHPLSVLVVVAPAVAGGLAGCVFSGRCKFTS